MWRCPRPLWCSSATPPTASRRSCSDETRSSHSPAAPGCSQEDGSTRGLPRGHAVGRPRCCVRSGSQRRPGESTEEAGLVVDPSGLVWFAHWTPPTGTGTQRRFATWFFAARAPSGAVTVDDGEIRDHQWIRPADAFAPARRRRDPHHPAHLDHAEHARAREVS